VLPISPKRALRICKWLAYAAITTASFYILFWSIAIFLISRDLYLCNVWEAAAENARGDRVFAETNFGGTKPTRRGP
jgi:hypothetical protein